MYKKYIETKDLYLAKAKDSDLESIFYNFWSQKETAKFMLWKPCETLEEAKERLSQVIEFQKDKMAYFIYEKESGKAIGMAGMREIAPDVYQDCGIGMGKDFVGKGYGKQILKAFIDYIFNELNGKKIVCSADKRNIPSAKLQQSCGLKYSHSEKNIRKWNNEEYIQDFYEIEK